MKNTAWEQIARITLALLLGLMVIPVFYSGIRIPLLSMFVSAMGLVNFFFHEAGHFILSFDGMFLMVAGGSIVQFTLPLMLLISGLWRRNAFVLAWATWWIGMNFVEVGRYASDARSRQLELLSPMAYTGAEIIHDWAYMLSKLNLLWADQIIGGAFALLGLLLMVGAAMALALPPGLLLAIFSRKSASTPTESHQP